MPQAPSFHVGITDDIYDKTLGVPSARQALENTPGLEITRFRHGEDPVHPQELDAFDAIMAGGLRVNRTSLDGLARCSLIVRFGAGFDRLDLDACTEAGLIVATTPNGIRRAMSTAAMVHILTMSTKFLFKRDCTYNGRWFDAATGTHAGIGLTGRTIGFVGFGNIGQDLYRLIKPFEMQHLVCDPYLDDSTAASFDIERVDLPTLLAQSDFVVILCLLTDETHHLIGAPEFVQMKNTAYLVNVARGAIIDQKALAHALATNQIAGAGLDAYDPEPIDADDPLLTLENANLTPHALGYTDEMIRLCSEGCVEATLAVRQGQQPISVINRPVLETTKLQEKLDTYRQLHGP